MIYTKQQQGDTLTFTIKGKFVFSDHIEFKNIIQEFDRDDIHGVRLNLGDVEFIDSAALGLLLMAKDKSDKSSKQIVLEKPAGQVAKMFAISRFDEIFSIEQ